MIDVIGGIHHAPYTTYSAADGTVVAVDLYPHKRVSRQVCAIGSQKRATALAERLNTERRDARERWYGR